ncbi:MAG: ATP synthase F1 subunit epsilon [Planctomycetes bacterium]|nr:ATP synthase F1 subunit epsilon [Planctomycetota bacterium]
MSETTSTDVLRCVVVTPEETVLETEADFVALPLFDGELGVAKHHSPMIGRLGYGELRIRQGAETTRHYVEGGFVQVTDNVVSVLTNRAIKADSIDTTAAQQQLDSALGQTAAGDEQLAIRDRTVAQSRAQLRAARQSK